MYCESRCRMLGNDEMCRYDPNARLNVLDANEHLRRFLRLCFTHHTRKIHDLRPYISRDVEQAMRSLASTTPLSDYDGVLAIIRDGGKKAKGAANCCRDGCFPEV